MGCGETILRSASLYGHLGETKIWTWTALNSVGHSNTTPKSAATSKGRTMTAKLLQCETQGKAGMPAASKTTTTKSVENTKKTRQPPLVLEDDGKWTLDKAWNGAYIKEAKRLDDLDTKGQRFM